MQREQRKMSRISTEDPDNLEIFALAKTISGNLTANEVAPGIHVISNALDEDELKYLNKLCRETTQEGWAKFYDGWDFSVEEESVAQTYRDYWFDKSLLIDNKPFCEKLIDKVKPFFGSGYSLPVFAELHRQKIGDGMDEHCDMGSRSNLLRSMIFYINDDYEGGELYFPALNFEYKPKPGDFVTFPSYEKYTHGVKPVLSGSARYVLAGFAWAAGKYNI
jgi:hypothetical protein